MRSLLKPLLYWSPRTLGILCAVFFGLFALDVFGEGLGFWKTLLALAIYLMPTWLVLVALFISWKWERVGGIIFISLGAVYIITAWGKFDWSAYLMISGPLTLVGGLFLSDGFYRLRRQQ